MKSYDVLEYRDSRSGILVGNYTANTPFEAVMDFLATMPDGHDGFYYAKEVTP